MHSKYFNGKVVTTLFVLILINLFLYALAHQAEIFEMFIFELGAFSFDFKIDFILVWQLMSLNKKMVVSSGKFNICISWSPICTLLILVLASMKIASSL